jgi:hypothetical protein
MQRIRNRAAATAIAALFAAAPLALGTAAYAYGPVQESGKEVVFSGGGLLGVACGAKPSTTSVTVPAESSLRVVNNTGRRAKLVLDGATRGEISSGSAADVLFHRGPVSLALKPDCVLADESSVRVEVVAAPPAAAPEPPGNAPAAPATGGGTSGDNNGGGGTSTGGSTGRTTRAADPRERPDGAATASADPTTPAAEPTPGDGTETATATVDGNLPALTEPTDSVTVAGANAEPLASVEPVRTGGSTGLLALIASVCVVGVSAGAIRAIIAQRATRTRTA